MSERVDAPFLLKKEELLRENPIYQNTVRCEEIYRPDFSLSKLHLHEFVEISLVVAGTGIHRILNDTVECRRGDMTILNIGVPHGYFAKSPEEMPTVCNLLFDPADWFAGALASPDSPDFCCGIFLRNTLDAYLPLKPRQQEGMERIFQSIGEEIREKSPQWKEAIRAHLTLLLVSVFRCQEQSRASLPLRSDDEMIVSAAMRAVMEQYQNRGLTLESIADALYLSKSRLCRLFYRVTGEHFSDYLRNVRLKQACRLLKETDLSNEQIVYRCGLKDVPSFYRLFRAGMSMTPGQYRKNQRKNSSDAEPE